VLIESRSFGGKVGEDSFNLSLGLPCGRAMTEQDLDKVIPVIL
jgi:hypothetical protein